MQVCTIIARNYWAHLRVLARSVAEHHPQARFTALVIDADGATVEGADRESFEVLGPSDIGLDRTELLRMAAIYDVLELSTALKPWLLRTLLERGAGPVVYLDPDIEVFAPLDEVFERAERSGIVLTPHTVSPLPPDAEGTNERTILQAGTYNLGFIAVGGDASGFLDWWSQRLSRDCLISKEEGLFVDQKWIDLVPNYFEPDVLREPGWNVAYWNLQTRSLEHGHRGYLVNGQPLRFFHYSGFDPEHPRRLSYYLGSDPRNEVADPVLAELCARYAGDLIRAGHRAWRRVPYPFDRSSTGLRLDRRARTIYRKELVRAERGGSDGSRRVREPVNPFTDGAAFERWLNEIVGPQEITRYLEALYHERDELKLAFPDVMGADARLFVDWVRVTGAAHERIPERLVPRPPSHVRPAGVNLAGYLAAENGVGEAARRFEHALRAGGIPTNLTTYRNTRSRQQAPHPPDPGAERDELADVNVVCVNADQFPNFRQDAADLFDADRYTVAVWAWELDRMPEWMGRSTELADEIWTYSDDAARAIERWTDKPVLTVPPPIGIPVAGRRRATRRDLGLPEGFLFLFCFDFDSVFERKNPIGVVEAFRRAFPSPCGPHLVIKSVRGEAHPDDLTRLRGAASGRPDIHVIDGYHSAEDQAALMASCDAYVSLHRSEGFGFTIAEAMALGKPVIATASSGNLGFMDETNSWLIGAGTVEVGAGNDPYPADAVWADPDLDAAAAAMRRVVDDPQLAASRGRRAAQDVVRLHGADIRAAFIRDRLEEIAAARRESSVPDDGHVWTAVDSADHYLSSGPDLGSPTRYGFLSRWFRRFTLRFIRHYHEHQDRVQHSLVDSVRDLQERLAAETAAVRDLEAKLRVMEARLDLGSDPGRAAPADIRDLPPAVPAPRAEAEPAPSSEPHGERRR